MGCCCFKYITTMNHPKEKNNKSTEHKNRNSDCSKDDDCSVRVINGRASKSTKVGCKQSNSEKEDESFEHIPEVNNEKIGWVDITIENAQGCAELINEPVPASPNTNDHNMQQISTLKVSVSQNDDFEELKSSSSPKPYENDEMVDGFVMIPPENNRCPEEGKKHEIQEISISNHTGGKEELFSPPIGNQDGNSNNKSLYKSENMKEKNDPDHYVRQKETCDEKSNSQRQKHISLPSLPHSKFKKNGNGNNQMFITIEMRKSEPLPKDEKNTEKLQQEKSSKLSPVQPTKSCESNDDIKGKGSLKSNNIIESGAGIDKNEASVVNTMTNSDPDSMRQDPVSIDSTEDIFMESKPKEFSKEPGTGVPNTNNPFMPLKNSCEINPTAKSTNATEAIDSSLKKSKNHYVLSSEELIVHPVSPASNFPDDIDIPSTSGLSDSNRFAPAQTTDSEVVVDEDIEDIYSAGPSSNGLENHQTLSHANNIGKMYPILSYAEKEWKGKTSKAHIIKKGYSQVSSELGYDQLRLIRGDNYCAIRAALFTALARNIDVLSTTQIKDITEVPEWLLSAKYSWVEDWTFARRLPYELSNVIMALKECLKELQFQNAEAKKINSDEERELYFVNQFNQGSETDIKLLEAVKLLMLLNAAKLYKAYTKGEEVPVFVWLLFARDTSEDPEKFMRNHLNVVGDVGGLEQIEMFLLGYTLGATIRVLRLLDVDGEDFVTYYPDDHIEDWPVLTLVAEDDRHYNVVT